MLFLHDGTNVKFLDDTGLYSTYRAFQETSSMRPVLALLYLHGFADVHSVKESRRPFHEQLDKTARDPTGLHP